MKIFKPTLMTAALAVATALALGAPAAASAKPVSYAGETSGGFPITFKRVGGAVKNVQALLPTSCVPAGEGTPTAGDEIYAPPGSLALGREVRTSALQDAAMHYDDVTKNYRFTASKRRSGTIAGRLHVNFSFQTVVFGAEPRLLGWVCQGDATFNAKPARG
jgi:hypothetical protein